MLAPFGMGRMDQNTAPPRTTNSAILPTKRSVPIALRLHVHGKTPQFRQAVDVVAQILLRPLPIVTALDDPVFAGPNDERPAAVILVLQEFERVRSLDRPRRPTVAAGQMPRSFDPQQAFPRGSGSDARSGSRFRELHRGNAGFVPSTPAPIGFADPPPRRSGRYIRGRCRCRSAPDARPTTCAIGVVQFRGVVDQKHGSLAGGNVSKVYARNASIKASCVTSGRSMSRYKAFRSGGDASLSGNVPPG